MSSNTPWAFDPASNRYYRIDASGRHVYQDVQGPRISAQVPRTSAGLNAASSTPTNTASLASTGPYSRPVSGESDRGSYTFTRPTGAPSSLQPPGHGYGPGPEAFSRDFASMSLRDNVQGANFGTAAQTSQQALRRSPPGSFRDASGRLFVDFTDPRNKVRSLVQTGPPKQIPTDPELAKDGISSHMFLFGTEGDEELLFRNFRKRDRPRSFFTKGKVFRVLWSEPAAESNTDVTMLEKGTSVTRFGELVYSKVRRFVVVREGDSYCSALPITTYNHRGVSKPGVKKSEHSIIYTGKVAPSPLADETPQLRGEMPMRPDAIRVNTDNPTEKLDEFSRIDYGKVYTIQHNI